MATSKPLPILLVACLTASSWAQAPESSPERSRSSEPATPSRGISRETAAALSAAYKYQPPPPEPEDDEDVDMREVDKPRNEIIRLPRFLVEEQRPPIFSEQNLYNARQLEKLAAQRYLSDFHRNMLSRYRIGRDDEAYARLRYQEELRLQAISTFGQQAALYRAGGDEQKAAAVDEQSLSIFIRQPEIGTTRLPGAPFGIQQSR